MAEPIRWKATVSFPSTQGSSVGSPLTLRDLERLNDCPNARNAALYQRLKTIYALLAQMPPQDFLDDPANDDNTPF